MKTRLERMEHISKALAAEEKNPNKRTDTIRWREDRKVFTVIRIDIAYVMFRIENSRTLREQIQYLETHPNADTNTFSDAETTLAQNAQKEILDDMLKSTGKDITTDLDQRGQQDPAIITHDGFLVNGNRRTAAMKNLKIQYIDCIVLPDDATKREIYDLEQELQLAQEFKEDYHWVNELLNIDKGLRELKIPEDDIAKRMRRKPPEIRARHRMKILIDEFLSWRKIPRRYDYDRLDEAEQIFIELEKAMRDKKYDPARREQLKLGVFALTENPPEEGRLYGHVRNFIANFDQIYERLGATNAGTSTSPSNAQETNEDKDPSLIDEILNIGATQPTPTISTIIDDLKEHERAKDLSPVIFDAIEDVKAQNKQKRNSEAVYDGVTKALREIHPLSVDDSASKLEETKQKLIHLIKIAQDLLSEIEKRL
jgi:ParB-like nuclease family protein